jgi:L-histidine N-alpha-methyltransferase
MRATGAAPVTIRRLSQPGDRHAQLAADVRAGLTATPKHLPSKYFYDARGSELFELITELPEYYLTRAETQILASNARAIVSSIQPDEIVELGSGSSIKTRILLETMRELQFGTRYVPIDVSQAALEEALLTLCTDYPWLEIDGLVGDFVTDLHRMRRRGRRLIVFLGSTVGNFDPEMRSPFLAEVRRTMTAGDGFLLGVDLVKEEPRMVAAYDDAAGISAQFNLNILSVVNRELDGDIAIDAFEHVTRFLPGCACMEQSLRATRSMHARLDAIDLDVSFAAGEEIITEKSCKFTRAMVEEAFTDAGLELREWITEGAGDFEP